jgi:hypothetical protein
MRIRLRKIILVPNLVEDFERAGFVVELIEVDTIDVSRPAAPDDEQARREIELHLQVWRAGHPGAEVETEPSD